MSATQLVGPDAVYPGGATSLQQIVPAYVYSQYADDDNIQALTAAQNAVATQFLLWFNTVNLPIYTGGVVSGALLDWVAQGLYGISRPSITTGMVTTVGAMNSFVTNSVAMNAPRVTSTLAQQTVNDDIFRRVLTWNLYRGDGFTFNIQWLKRRVLRFLNGPNGIAPTIDQTYGVSVGVSGSNFAISVSSASPIVSQLNSLIGSGACVTPFQYGFTFSTGAAGLYDNAGVVTLLSPPDGYPTSAAGLGVGALFSNGGVVCVAGTTAPSGSPVYFANVNAASLLALGGANLPLTAPATGSGQLWNNAGVVCIA